MKEAQTGTYQYFKDYEKEMHIACSNVDAILGKARGKDLSKSKERGAFWSLLSRIYKKDGSDWTIDNQIRAFA